MYITETSGTSYYKGTNQAVIDILERVRYQGERIRLYYGDVETGRDWRKHHGVTGRIGRSTGQIKIPILLYNKRSMFGSGILTDCIVKIETTKGKRVLYQHPDYHV